MSTEQKTMTVDQARYHMLLKRVGQMEEKHATEIVEMEVRYMLKLDEQQEKIKELTDIVQRHAGTETQPKE